MFALRQPANVTLNVTLGRRLGKRWVEEAGGEMLSGPAELAALSMASEDGGGRYDGHPFRHVAVKSMPCRQSSGPIVRQFDFCSLFRPPLGGGLLGHSIAQLIERYGAWAIGSSADLVAQHHEPSQILLGRSAVDDARCGDGQ